MEILLLTVFLSLLLAVFFLILFLRNKQRATFGGMEQDALRPFQAETPKEARKK